MLAIKGQIAESIAKIIKNMNDQAELDEATVLSMLEYPPDEKMGDIALPCFKLSKTMRRSPVQIAAALAEGFSSDAVERAEAVNGYFNLYLSPNRKLP